MITPMSAAEPLPRTFWAPGRVNLIGEHTDYSDGLVLPFAVDRGRHPAAVSPRERRPTIRLPVPAVARCDPLVISHHEESQGWSRYVVGVLVRCWCHRVRGADIAIDRRRARAPGSVPAPRWRWPVASALNDTVRYLGMTPMELALLSQRAENDFVGTPPCGIMDQAASILGQPGHAVLLDTGSLDWELVRLPADHAIVVVDSGVRHSLEQSAYATRREELERGLAGAGDPVARRRVRHVRVGERARARGRPRPAIGAGRRPTGSETSSGTPTRASASTSRSRRPSSTSWSSWPTASARPLPA